MNTPSPSRDRIEIGLHYENIPTWKILVGVPLIYIPAIITTPFVIVGLFLVRMHLLFLGAKNLKKYKDFIPSRKSFRYNTKNQIVVKKSWVLYTRSKLYWVYNCGIYCPYSVALFEYGSYLVKAVENWWCPFDHSKKSEYVNASIDKSFWHIDKERRKQLHPDDLDNPTWNKDSK